MNWKPILLIAALFVCCSSNSKVEKKSESKEQIDVTVAVENPEFKLSLVNFINNGNEDNSILFRKQFNGAKFLIPILTDQLKTKDKGNNEYEVQEKSQISILNYINEKNETFLPVFTDWKEIRIWTKENVSSLIIPANKLWGFTSKNKNYVGIVINPGSSRFVLSNDKLNNLREDTNQTNEIKKP